MIKKENKQFAMIMIPSAVLMKRSILQRFPQVALTCLAFLSWFSGAVMTQQRTRTFSDIFLAFKSSPKMWTQQISYDDINSFVLFLYYYGVRDSLKVCYLDESIPLGYA